MSEGVRVSCRVGAVLTVLWHVMLWTDASVEAMVAATDGYRRPAVIR